MKIYPVMIAMVKAVAVARFTTATSEAGETATALDLSVACGYLQLNEVELELDRLDHIVAVMWMLLRART